MSESSKNLLFAIIVISHFFFGLQWMISFIKEIRKTIMKKFPNLYLSLFLCGNTLKFEKELYMEEYLKT